MRKESNNIKCLSQLTVEPVVFRTEKPLDIKSIVLQNKILGNLMKSFGRIWQFLIAFHGNILILLKKCWVIENKQIDYLILCIFIGIFKS